MYKVLDSDKNNSANLIQRVSVNSNKTIINLQLNRPNRANAYNDEMLDILTHEIQEISNENVARAIIFTGTGNRAFCAGADKNELIGRGALEGLNLKSRKLFEQIAALPILTIAAINGAAIGGGLELALACDIRVCATTAKFSFPELNLGIIPAAGGINRLPTIVGKSRAKEMILLGRELDATTALNWGLIAYSGDDFEAKALALAEQAALIDPIAATLAKKVIDSDQHAEQQELSAVVQALLYELKIKRG